MSDVPALVAEVRSTFKSGRTRSLAWRVQQLNACKAMLNDNADRWCAAVEADTLKPHTDALIGDICVAQAELDSIMSNLKAWMTPQDAGTPLTLIPATSRVEKQPHGCTLVIGPCNYPLQLTLCPMYGAIAAGNTVVLKPSEQCPQVAELLASFVKAYLDPDAVKVVLGGVEATSALLDQKWDHIIFTGSTRIGKIVAAAAAKHLTPTTLELGGKCPVIIDGNTSEPIESIADKIFFGRFFSGGQSCVAPEYVLVPRDLVSGFTSAFVRMIGERFGETGRVGQPASLRPPPPRSASASSSPATAARISAEAPSIARRTGADRCPRPEARRTDPARGGVRARALRAACRQPRGGHRLRVEPAGDAARDVRLHVLLGRRAPRARCRPVGHCDGQRCLRALCQWLPAVWRPR